VTLSNVALEVDTAGGRGLVSHLQESTSSAGPAAEGCLGDDRGHPEAPGPSRSPGWREGAGGERAGAGRLQTPTPTPSIGMSPN